MKNDPDIKPMNFNPPDKWYLMETNARRDSFYLWLTDSTYIKQDTMKIDLGYPTLDSLGNIYTKRDTLIFLYRKTPVIKPQKGIKQKDEGKSKLKMTTITNKATVDLNRNIPFVFNYPLENIDSSRIRLSVIKDSVEQRFPYDFKKDSISPRKIFLNTKWIEKSQYKLRVFPGAFTDMYKNINDTLICSFNTADRETYGTINITISGVTMPVIVQIMGDRENIYSEKYTSKDGKLVFDYLKAGKYRFKFIYDANNNRKWDTGYYLKDIQPERVAYYKGEIDVKSNWVVDISWAADNEP